MCSSDLEAPKDEGFLAALVGQVPGLQRRAPEDPLPVPIAEIREILHGNAERVVVSLSGADGRIIAPPHETLWSEGVQRHARQRRYMLEWVWQVTEFAETGQFHGEARVACQPLHQLLKLPIGRDRLSPDSAEMLDDDPQIPEGIHHLPKVVAEQRLRSAGCADHEVQLRRRTPLGQRIGGFGSGIRAEANPLNPLGVPSRHDRAVVVVLHDINFASATLLLSPPPPPVPPAVGGVWVIRGPESVGEILTTSVFLNIFFLKKWFLNNF